MNREQMYVNKRVQAKRFFAGDLIIFFTILLLAVGSFLLINIRSSDGKLLAVITQNGTERYRIALEEVTDRIEIEIDGSYVELLVAENGRIRFERADCPDQICVNTGWISRPGQVAVCVPAGVIVKIVGYSDEEEEIDIFLQ